MVSFFFYYGLCRETSLWYPCFILVELVCHWTLFVFNQWNYRTCSVAEVVVFFLSVLMVRVQSLVNTDFKASWLYSNDFIFIHFVKDFRSVTVSCGGVYFWECWDSCFNHKNAIMHVQHMYLLNLQFS